MGVVHSADQTYTNDIFAQTQEMANEYPNSKFTGIDVSVGWPTEIRPRNCDFVVGNIVNELPFADNTFDFVYMRLVGMGVSNGEYPIVLKQLYRVLKPGGWIELVEVRYRAMERRRSSSILNFVIPLKLFVVQIDGAQVYRGRRSSQFWNAGRKEVKKY